MSPIFVSLVAFCFSMTIGVLWEFFEYGADNFLKTDMQKDRVVEEISTVYIHPDGENIPIIVNDIGYTIISNGGAKEIKIENGYLDIGLIDTMTDVLIESAGALVAAVIYCLDKGRHPVFTMKDKDN